MNKIHNVIWSKAQNAWVVVAEGTKSNSKSGAKALKVMVALMLLSPAGAMAATLPQGGVITVGKGSIVNNGGNQLVIKQGTDKLGVNWQSFNIGPDGHVIFDQPGKNSIALNRVVGSDGSSILGKIDANGQVFLINPNGVIFGKGAEVNVGGLVASTLNITDEDFKSGNFKFNAGGSNAGILNEGSLQSAEGGYVALLGKSVKNNGVIRAKLGTAALAAGSAVTLDFSGDGLITVQVNESTIKALAENKGLITADGGSVLMTARASNALLDTVVNNEGIIQAKTIENRSGKIFLDGGFESGTVAVAGTLDASAPDAGNGGFIDTSGANVKISDDVKVNTLAKAGVTGEWLIDPTDFNIDAGTGANTFNSIGATTLSEKLETTNVSIATSAISTPGQLGDINVNSALSWGANTKLTLTAHNDINIKDKISINGDTGGLALNYAGRVNVVNGGSVKLNGANTTYSEKGVDFQILRSATDLNIFTTGAANNKKFALGGDIDASEMSSWNGGKGFDSYGGSGLSVSNVVFNGLGNTISDFYVNRPSESYVGLFGVFYTGTLSNLHMTGTVIGNDQTGMVAGETSSSKIFNVTTSGTVNGNAEVGGVFGYAYSSKLIDNVGSTADVIGQGSKVGGIIGSSYTNTLVSGLRYSGQVKGFSHVGGLVGDSYADKVFMDFATSSTTSVTGGSGVGGAIGFMDVFTSATDISGSGVVTGNWASGGAIGFANNGSLKNVKSDATVTGTDSVGGLIGEMSYMTLDSAFATGNATGTGVSTGGLIGASSGSYISNSLSTGEVKGTQDVGGLVGLSSSDQIKTSFSTSKASGTTNVGGFAGSLKQSIITNAYATGEVAADTANSGGFTGNSYYTNYKYTYSTGKNSSASATGKGGFIGVINGDVFTSSYWDTQKSGMSTSAGGAIGKTTAQLSQASTFAGWGISTTGATDSNVWRIYEGNSAPLLKFLMGTGNAQQGDISSTYTSFAQTPTITAGMNTVSNVVADSFFSSLLNLSADGLSGGDSFGGVPMINAGVYTIANPLYSNQFGLNLTQDSVGTFTINKAVLTFNADADNKVYDATTGATASLSANALGSDVLSVTGYNTQFTDKNAGLGKTVTINGITLSGAAASNYTWGDLTTTADISKANLTVSASGNGKTYDGTTSGTANLTDNRLGGDVLSLSGNAAFGDKNAGTGKLMNVTDILVTGDDAANYSWNETAVTTADIGKATLVIGAVGQDKAYDGSTNASVSLTDDRIAGDVLNISSSSSFADKNAGAGKVVNVNGITVTGDDAQNYSWNGLATATATITKALLNVFANAQDRTYDGTNNAQVTLGDDRIAGDDLIASYGTSTFSDKNAGTGKTVTVGGITLSGADADNYDFSSTATAQADIAKANLVVKADNASKVEGAADGQLHWNLQSGTVYGGDSINGSLSRDAGENVGLYDINQGDLSAGANYELSVVPGVFEITQEVKPPVIIDPIDPPVIIDPIDPPVVIDPPTPPVVVTPKPPENAELEHAKEIVSTISVAAKVSNSASASEVPHAKDSGVKSDYRLLNLGMKLPEDLTSEEGATF